MIIYLAKKAQTSLLLVEKIIISIKYLDFADVFLKKLTVVLPKQTKAKKYAIKLEKSKQSLYTYIYSLEFV